jgi:uncharacterized protein (TIGR00255 family)
MTGFGGSRREHESASVRVEVRSVNHRHLQVKTRVPLELGALESIVDKRVRTRLNRGSVSVNVSVAVTSASQAATINQELLGRYRNQLQSAARDLGIDGGLDLATLIGLPGVLTAPEPGADEETLAPMVLETVDAALDELVAMRNLEGAAMEAELRRLAAELAAVVEQIEQRVPAAVTALQENLRERVQELLSVGANGAERVELAPADLAREVALLADRTDIAEELARLKSHFDQLESMLGADEAVGRRLDFLVQELLREVNTIGSKASDAEIAHLVIDAKTAIERLREQIQNVE